MKKRIAITVLLLVCFAMQSVFACFITGVGRLASSDGSTMTSHTCDSTGDDLRLWLIPSMEEGSERDVVVSGRKDADYSNFPEVKDYGSRGIVMDTYVNDKDTYQYLHAMYSFANEKGVTMNESTCGWTTEQRTILGEYEGIWDCYMLQDAALENCATAKEAVEFMGAKISEQGWNGWPECIIIADGTDLWAFEAYGGNMWCAFRVPDDAFFFCANRCRIDFWEENSDTYLADPNMKQFALDTGLWNGEGEFRPCQVFAAGNNSFSCVGREWRAVCNIENEYSEAFRANEDLALTKTPDDDFPLYLIPTEKISVQTIFDICGDHYEGTKYDNTKSAYAGMYGNPYSGSYEYRPTSVPQCTYFQISNVKAWLPEEVRCLVWFGWGAPSTTYMTPVFASQTELADHFGRGTRYEYDPESGWWNEALVQTAATLNYADAIQVIRDLRDPIMETQYEVTFAVQNQAAKMIKNGQKDAAIDLLTTYANGQAEMWFDLYDELSEYLLSRYVVGRIEMKKAPVLHPEWWSKVLTSVSYIQK